MISRAMSSATSLSRAWTSPAGAPRRREDALLPEDGLRSERLQIEQVVVELDIPQAPRGYRGQRDRHERDRLRVGDQPFHERYVDALQRERARDRPGRPTGVS